ncbi:hypothetical protein ACFL18_01830 [Patescibacteria group bacterium]
MKDNHSFTDPVQFYLLANQKPTNPEAGLNRIITHLNTVSGVSTLVGKNNNISIFYGHPLVTSLLETNLKKNKSDLITSQEFLLTCERHDNVAVNLLRSVISSIDYRLYNPTLKCYMVNELNLMDLTTIKLDKFLKKIFKLNGLKPLFQYRNNMIFYAKKTKDNTIHLVNNHLINYFMQNKASLKKSKHISVKVAPDIATFIALFDRGLIPTSFYQSYLTSKTKIVNLTGFNFKKLDQDIYLTPLYFKLDKKKQSFKQIMHNEEKYLLTKGKSVIRHINKLLKKTSLSSDYLAIKVGANIDYQLEKTGKLIPRFSFIIYST